MHVLYSAENEKVRMADSEGMNFVTPASGVSVGAATSSVAGIGSVRLRAHLHRLLVEQILAEHTIVLNEGSCLLKDKQEYLTKCIEHIKEVLSTHCICN